LLESTLLEVRWIDAASGKGCFLDVAIPLPMPLEQVIAELSQVEVLAPILDRCGRQGVAINGKRARPESIVGRLDRLDIAPALLFVRKLRSSAKP
jgi:hypothetical protein